MVSKRARALLGTLALATCMVPTSPVRAAPAESFRVGLIGDSGYNADGEQNFLRVREAANSAGLAFVVHDGDIWMGGTYCNDERLRRVKAEVKGVRTPVYTPGDNEWGDCPGGAARGGGGVRPGVFAPPVSRGTPPHPHRRPAPAPRKAPRG